MNRPSLLSLTRIKPLMWPLNLVMRLDAEVYRELRGLAPLHLRMRIGSRQLFCNAVQYRYGAVDFWMHAFADGLIHDASDILDIGCGCGRYAIVLRRLNDKGWRYRGHYTGIDIDAEMIRWADRHFPRDQFRFIHVDQHSSVYNPAGERTAASLPVDDASQDFVFSTSLFTHLLEDAIHEYLRESLRVLRPGGAMRMSVFSIDHVAGRARKRWKFEQRVGAAYVYDPQRPEAAVAYDADWLTRAAAQAGFVDARIEPHKAQSDLLAFKPEGVAI